MIGSIIGGALKVGGAIAGGITAANAMRKKKQALEDRKQKNQNWYDRRYNEDATQRADAQRMWSRLEGNVRDRNKAAAGMRAVMGGTEESVASVKAANNEALADAASRIVAAGEARKDNIESQYMQRDDQLQGQLNQMEVDRANNVVRAAEGMGQAGAGIASSLDEAFAPKEIVKPQEDAEQKDVTV